ncbi:MAG: hypothetical protein Q8N53_23220 [Longimicrobiales bacterium]|nr:hypothetical protein [Longimicrobiales bacterium]
MTGVGAAAIVRNSSPSRRMVAAIPLLFAAQQAAEGVVWLTIAAPSSDTLHRLAVDAYLAFALVIWPLWAPWAFRLAERHPARRRVLRALSWVGGIVSVAALLLLLLRQPIASLDSRSVSYTYAGTTDGLLQLLGLTAYAIPVLVPFFVSTVRSAPMIGATLVVSVVAAMVVEKEALLSVWCFFAAIVSVLILVAVDREERRTAAPRAPAA